MIASLKSARALILSIAVLALVAGGIFWWTMRDDHKLPGRLVDYHKIYDVFWDVACDTAMDGSDRLCYVQYVDVYRPRPEFAAAMVEVVVHEGADGQSDPHVRFDIEPGLSFQNTMVGVKTEDAMIPIDVSGCASNTCRFSGDEGRAILANWRKGSAIELVIEEGRDTPAQLSWPLGNINEILDDFAAQRAERNLP